MYSSGRRATTSVIVRLFATSTATFAIHYRERPQIPPNGVVIPWWSLWTHSRDWIHCHVFRVVLTRIVKPCIFHPHESSIWPNSEVRWIICSVMCDHGTSTRAPALDFGGGGIGISCSAPGCGEPESGVDVCSTVFFCIVRKAVKEGTGRGIRVGRLTTRSSFFSPATNGRPAAVDSNFQCCQGSPPATSISSFRIAVDHFSCMSTVCCLPSAKICTCQRKSCSERDILGSRPNSTSISGLHVSSAALRTFSTRISRSGFAHRIRGSCSFTKCLR